MIDDNQEKDLNDAFKALVKFIKEKNIAVPKRGHFRIGIIQVKPIEKVREKGAPEFSATTEIVASCTWDGLCT